MYTPPEDNAERLLPQISALDSTNVDQFHSWDGANGVFWSGHAGRFDEGVASLHGELLKTAEIGDDSTVLDIGCGAGQLTRDAARTARCGSALGIDLSSPLLDVAQKLAAKERVENVSFVQADAQVYDFGTARFDVAVSRHGTMFFGDPRAAFANIARAVRPGGRLVQLVWQPLERNEGIRTFRRIAAGGYDVPPPPPERPSPFSLSDPDRVDQLLRDAGFVDIEMAGLTAPMYYGGDVDDAFDFIAAHNAPALAELDNQSRASAMQAPRSSITEHLTSRGVYYGSAHWLICARRATGASSGLSRF